MKIKSLSFYVSLLFLSCWVIGFVLFALYTFSLKYAEPQNAEAIVVLTGSSDRINTAFDLLQQNKAEKLFISGVNSKVSVGALFQKIDEDMVNRIQLGYKADNTYENAMETHLWLQQNKVSSVLLVTSFYHMPRSIFEVKERIGNVKIIPYPVFPKQLNANWFHTRSAWLLFVEYNKFIVVYIRSFLRRFFL